MVVAIKWPSFTTTGCKPTDVAGTVRNSEHIRPVPSMAVVLLLQGKPPNVIPPTGTVPSGVILVTHTIRFVPIGRDEGVIVITGDVIVKVATDTVPAVVVTDTALPPQQAAVWGTLRLVDQLPEPSIGITTVFHGAPSNFIPPMGIVSRGTKLEPVMVASV